MKKKRLDLEEQKKSGLAFLQKLSTIKKASKQIKQKNKLTVHKIQWGKQFKYLNKLERNLEKETYDMLQSLDVRFVKEFQQYQVFGKENEKSYLEIYEKQKKKVDLNNENISYQIDSLREVLKKVKESPQFYEVDEVRNIIENIGNFFNQLEQVLQEQAQAIDIKNDFIQNDQQGIMNETVFTQEKMLLSNQVKGFDIKKERIMRMTSNENVFRQFLEGTGLTIQKHDETQMVEQFYKAMSFLQQRYELEFEKLDMDYQQALTMDESILQSANYLKLNHIYNSYLGRGKDRNLYSERLLIEFPNISRKNLDILTAYLEAKIFKGKKRKALWRNFYKEKSDLIDKAEQQIIKTIENKIEEGKIESQKLQRKEDQIKLGEKLVVLKKQFQKKKQQKEKQVLEQEKKKKEEEEKEQKLWKQHAQEVGKKAEVYKKQTEEKKIQSQIVRKQQQKYQKQVNQKKIIQNKPKVQIRQSIQQKKISQKLQKKQEAVEQKIYQEQRIQNAIRSYSHRPNVEADFERLKAPTTSLLSKKVQYDKADKIDLVKVHGYNVGQLMNDMRYRLNMAFQDAGLSGAQYAREIINQMSRPKET